MSDPRPAFRPELLADTTVITAALQRAVREAVLQHARAGFPVSTMRDGKVVWIPPEEILARFADPPANGEKADGTPTPL
jgi:hypothetical protein